MLETYIRIGPHYERVYSFDVQGNENYSVTVEDLLMHYKA